MKRRGWLLVLSLLVLLPRSAGGAHTALVTGDLNVRLGPGMDFPVIGGIPGGSAVDALECRGIWCEIYLGHGEGGFVSRYYLDFDAFPPPRRARPVYRPHRHAMPDSRSYRRPHREVRSPRAAPRYSHRPAARKNVQSPPDDRATSSGRPPTALNPPVVPPPQTKPPAPAPVAPFSTPGPDQPTGSRPQPPEKPFSVPKDAPEISL